MPYMFNEMPMEQREMPDFAIPPTVWDMPEPCDMPAPCEEPRFMQPANMWDVPEACVALPVMAFVPVQRGNLSECVYEPEVAFGIGTLFPTLHKPWRVGYE
jgi:hypothetical protein